MIMNTSLKARALAAVAEAQRKAREEKANAILNARKDAKNSLARWLREGLQIELADLEVGFLKTCEETRPTVVAEIEDLKFALVYRTNSGYELRLAEECPNCGALVCSVNVICNLRYLGEALQEMEQRVHECDD